MRELKTLLVQLQNDEFQHAYDSSFRFAAAFVRNLKWAGPPPERDLPDQPEFDDPNDLNTWLAEAYAGYYIYGALLGVPGAGRRVLPAGPARAGSPAVQGRGACGGARARRLCGMVPRQLSGALCADAALLCRPPDTPIAPRRPGS